MRGSIAGLFAVLLISCTAFGENTASHTKGPEAVCKANTQGGMLCSQVQISDPHALVFLSKPDSAPSITQMIDFITQKLKATYPADNLVIKPRYQSTEKAPELFVQINDVRGKVITDKHYWERITVVFTFSTPSRQRSYFDSAISGEFAPGIGNVVPAGSEFTSFDPAYEAKLLKFQADLDGMLKAYIEAQQPPAVLTAAKPTKTQVRPEPCTLFRKLAKSYPELDLKSSPCTPDSTNKPSQTTEMKQPQK